ncbi:MAG: glycosyltransferase [Proteobacteria bacterium]|nr:glycosyltransferase [Pseudomonadota bacterium]
MRQEAGQIGVIFHDFPLGGSERISIRLMNQWADSGRKVVAFCGALRGPLVDLIGRNVEVVECGPAIPRAAGSRRRFGKALRGFLQTRAVDVLFCPGNYHWPVLSELTGMDPQDAPGIVTQISTPLYRHGRGAVEQFAYNILTRHRLRGIDAAIALSPSTVRQADKILGRKITQYIRLPVLDDGAASAPVMTRACGNVIVAAGRLVKEKGFDVAIRALARMQDRTARLVFLGDGPQLESLTLLAASLGVAERVEFAGYVRDISPWLAKARLLLMSSYYEGFGAVLVEALATGRPVVSTDCTPAINDLLIGLPGCHVSPIGDHVSMSGALDLALAQPAPDPRVLADAVEAYRIGPIADAHLDMFDRVHRARHADTALPERFAENVAYV